MTLFEGLTGGAFDRLNWQHSGEFDQNFSKKSNARGFARGAWGVLELTGTLSRENEHELCLFCRFSGIIIRGPNRTDFVGEMNV